MQEAIKNMIYFAGSTTPPSTLLFDMYGIGIAGFSLRKLSSDYTGYCIKVRRSSDNALQDIGFDGDVLDTTTLLSFVGSGSGYVQTLYNQGSVSANFTQDTLSKQPRIVNSGNLDTNGSKPCMVFSGGQVLSAGDNFDNYPSITNDNAQYMSSAVGSMLNSSAVLHGKISISGFSGQRGIVRTSNDFLLTGAMYMGASTKNTRALYSWNAENVTGQSAVTWDSFLINNTIDGTPTYRNRGESTYRYLIGAGDNSGSEFWYNTGIFQELIIYKDLTANVPSLSDVNTNINEYYSIYP